MTHNANHQRLVCYKPVSLFSKIGCWPLLFLGAESGQVSVLTVLEVFALGLVCATIAVVRSRVIHHFEESEKLEIGTSS